MRTSVISSMRANRSCTDDKLNSDTRQMSTLSGQYVMMFMSAGRQPSLTSRASLPDATPRLQMARAQLCLTTRFWFDAIANLATAAAPPSSITRALVCASTVKNENAAEQHRWTTSSGLDDSCLSTWMAPSSTMTFRFAGRDANVASDMANRRFLSIFSNDAPGIELKLSNNPSVPLRLITTSSSPSLSSSSPSLREGTAGSILSGSTILFRSTNNSSGSRGGKNRAVIIIPAALMSMLLRRSSGNAFTKMARMLDNPASRAFSSSVIRSLVLSNFRDIGFLVWS